MTFDTAFERSHKPNSSMTNEKDNPQMDWQQVALNGGPPCFALAGDADTHYCGRAQRWAGHDSHHKFVSLDDLLTTARKEEREAALKSAAKIATMMAAGETYETGRQKALNIAAALEAAASRKGENDG